LIDGKWRKSCFYPIRGSLRLLSFPNLLQISWLYNASVIKWVRQIHTFFKKVKSNKTIWIGRGKGPDSRSVCYRGNKRLNSDRKCWFTVLLWSLIFGIFIFFFLRIKYDQKIKWSIPKTGSNCSDQSLVQRH